MCGEGVCGEGVCGRVYDEGVCSVVRGSVLPVCDAGYETHSSIINNMHVCNAKYKLSLTKPNLTLIIVLNNLSHRDCFR